MMNYLELESLSEVDDMLKIHISGSSNGFSGMANAYVNEQDFQVFCEELSGFPKVMEQTASFNSGENEKLSYFELTFSCKDKAGNILVAISIHEINSYINSPTKRFSSQFEFVTEPAELDRFQASLLHVCGPESVGNKARLNAKT